MKSGGTHIRIHASFGSWYDDTAALDSLFKWYFIFKITTVINWNKQLLLLGCLLITLWYNEYHKIIKRYPRRKKKGFPELQLYPMSRQQALWSKLRYITAVQRRTSNSLRSDVRLASVGFSILLWIQPEERFRICNQQQTWHRSHFPLARKKGREIQVKLENNWTKWKIPAWTKSREHEQIPTTVHNAFFIAWNMRN